MKKFFTVCKKSSSEAFRTDACPYIFLGLLIQVFRRHRLLFNNLDLTVVLRLSPMIQLSGKIGKEASHFSM